MPDRSLIIALEGCVLFAESILFGLKLLDVLVSSRYRVYRLLCLVVHKQHGQLRVLAFYKNLPPQLVVPKLRCLMQLVVDLLIRKPKPLIITAQCIGHRCHTGDFSRI